MLGHDGDGPRPLLSVVVPAFNEAAWLGGCLRSLAEQDFDGAFEVIVVDNGSTDQTAQIARLHGAVVIREDRAGVCWARQAGTMAARGDVVVSTDADTTFDPGWLSRIQRTFEARPECVAVAGPCRFVAAPWWGRVYAPVLFLIVHLLRRLTGRVVYATATNIAFRKASWAGYDTSATQGGDELGLLRRLRSEGEIAFDLGNPCLTSSRRLRQGLAYNVLVTCLFYYLLGYGLNRLFGHRVVGTAPAFRREAAPTAFRHRATGMGLRFALAAACVALLLAAGDIVTDVAQQI